MTHKYSIQQNHSWLGTTRHYYKALNKDITKNDNNHNKISNNNQLLFNNSNEHVIVITTTTTCLYFGQFFSDFWKRVGTWRLRAVLCLNALFF